MTTADRNSRPRIVVGTDGSACSADAIRWAALEAKRRRNRLVVIHVFDPVRTVASPLDRLAPVERQRLAAETALSEAVGTVDVDVETERVMAHGHPVRELAALSAGAEMLVVGSRGLGGVASILLGSTSLRLAMGAPFPVVVVRSHQPHVVGFTGNRVVTAVDGGPTSDRVLEFAFTEAALRAGHVAAVHTYQPPDHAFTSDAAAWEWPQLHEREEELLAERLSPWREKYPDVPVTAEILRGYAAPALIAASEGAALVVLPRAAHHRLGDAVHGSTCRAIIHHAKCPVAVLPVD